MSMALWRRNDVRKFDADAILFREIQCKKMDMLSDVTVRFRFESGQICNNNDHTYLFHCINTGRSLWLCLNTRPNGLVLK